jgi:hypothetical protein
MSRQSSLSTLLPLLIGACAFATGCAFEPPDSVLGMGSQGEDGMGGGGGTGGGGGGGGGGNGGADAGAPAAGAETLTIAYTTQINSAAYGTNNVVAAWVENAQGEYQGTIDRKSGVRTRNLVAWVAAAPGGINNTELDVVSGATRLDHNAPVQATWKIPADLPEGTYTVRLETCDENSVTADQNYQGSFTFELNGQPSVQTDLTGDGYTGVKLDYSGAQ